MSGPLDTAERFHAALRDEDWKTLGAVLTDDARWIMPGDKLIAGIAHGRDAIIGRAIQIAAYNMRFHVRNVLVSADAIALIQRNTEHAGGNHHDELAATVCRLRDDQIYRIQTFVSDLPAFDRFFHSTPSCRAGVGSNAGLK